LRPAPKLRLARNAAVKFGVGRYLYRLPKQWVDHDPQKEAVKNLPQLATWAVPTTRQLAPATMTRDQALDLQRLLQEKSAGEPAKFLAAFGVKRLSEMPMDRFQDALATIKNPLRGRPAGRGRK
jgi:hypothetical protein